MSEVTDDEIIEDLATHGYPISKVTRMKGKESKLAPLVLVEIDREYNTIYNNLKQCLGLSIQAERQEVVQCHRRQLFGHVQKNCHGEIYVLRLPNTEDYIASVCQLPT